VANRLGNQISYATDRAKNSRAFGEFEDTGELAFVVDELLFETHRNRYTGGQQYRFFRDELLTLTRGGADLSVHWRRLARAFADAHPLARTAITKPLAIFMIRQFSIP